MQPNFQPVQDGQQFRHLRQREGVNERIGVPHGELDQTEPLLKVVQAVRLRVEAAGGDLATVNPLPDLPHQALSWSAWSIHRCAVCVTTRRSIIASGR